MTPDQQLIAACSNDPRTVDQIADTVGRSWPVVLGDLNRLARKGRITRQAKSWGKPVRWQAVSAPAPRKSVTSLHRTLVH